MTLRQRKKLQIREAIIETAYELFEAQGFEQTTAEQIAEAAGVARRTFFRYFGTKEAVIFPDRHELLPRFRALLQEAEGEGAPLGRVERALLGLAGDYMQARVRVRRRRQIVAASPALQAYDVELDREWEAAIAEALLPGGRASAAERRRAALIAGALMGATRACLDSWFAGGCRGDLVALGREAITLIERGVLATADRNEDAPAQKRTA